MRKIAFILVLILMLLQTGCWNAREINELAFVLCIGLDKAPEGFRVTAQIARPDTHSKSPTGGGDTSKTKPFLTVTSTGKTIYEAVRNMASISSRRIFWAHIKIILISEQLARENSLEVLDFFTRNPELRLRTLVAITPGEAKKLLEVTPMMEKDPSEFLEKIIQRNNLTGKSYNIMLKDFLEDYLDPYVGPVASRIISEESGTEQTLKTEGAYVFNGNKLSGTLSEEETRGLLWIKNKIKDTVMVVNCPFDGLPVTLEIKNARTSIKSSMEDGTPHFTINVNASANVTELACLTDYNDPQNLKALEKAFGDKIQNDIESTITAAKTLGDDFPGLSHALHRQHKDEFHQIASNWNEAFKNSQVDAVIKVDIPHVSLAKPMLPIKAK